MKLDDDYEEWVPEEEEEAEAVKPAAKILVFLGLVAAAAVICAILWNVTHRDNSKDNPAVEQTGESEPGGESNTASGQTPETMPEEGSEPGAETLPEEGSEPGAETLPEEGREPGAETLPEEGSEPDAETIPEESTEPSPESGEEPGASGGADNAGSEQNTGNGAMAFAECQDTVTPKEVINLRSAPNTGQADNIVTRAVNGEVLTRTGINSDTGWSRLEYNGQTLYAVTRYLTTDLTYQPPVAEPDSNSVNTKDGRTITFTDCDDNISPKMYVNLRLEPSTSEGNDTVHCRLEYGEVVHRTGISEDSGWSRVEYDGYVLYVVTSYMYVVEEQ